jgi:hypothetical protein
MPTNRRGRIPVLATAEDRAKRMKRSKVGLLAQLDLRKSQRVLQTIVGRKVLSGYGYATKISMGRKTHLNGFVVR